MSSDQARHWRIVYISYIIPNSPPTSVSHFRIPPPIPNEQAKLYHTNMSTSAGESNVTWPKDQEVHILVYVSSQGIQTEYLSYSEGHFSETEEEWAQEQKRSTEQAQRMMSEFRTALRRVPIEYSTVGVNHALASLDKESTLSELIRSGKLGWDLLPDEESAKHFRVQLKESRLDNATTLLDAASFIYRTVDPTG